MKNHGVSLMTYAVLVFFALVAIVPILVMWMAALKTSGEIYRDPFALPTALHWENLAKAWAVGRFRQYLGNSLIVTIPTVAGVVALSSLAGYAFGKLKFAGSKFWFYLFLLGLMVPFQSIMIPMYYDLQNFDLLGKYWAMILPATALGLPFGIFLMQAFFRGLPAELADAARVDGCSEFGVLFKIMLPLTGPAVSTLVVFQFMWTWNAFLMPLLFLNEETLRPVSLGLMFFSGRYTLNYGLVAAGVTLATLPLIVVYILFQRQFMRGLTAGALKG
jgi:ABC-type glycerol-3-phosphate transport system permease component